MLPSSFSGVKAETMALTMQIHKPPIIRPTIMLTGGSKHAQPATMPAQMQFRQKTTMKKRHVYRTRLQVGPRIAAMLAMFDAHFV